MLYWTAPPTVSYCDINVYGYVQGVSGHIEDSLLSVISVSGLNYHFLDRSRFAFFENNPTFLAFHGDLVAYDSNGTVIGIEPFDIGDDVDIVQGPDGDWNPYYPGCSRTCVGPNYAWAIQQYVHPNGGNALYKFDRAYTVMDQTSSGWPMITPYYEYVGLSVFEATFLSEPGGLLPYVTSWYNVTQDDWASVNMVGVEGFAPKIIKIPNTGEFRDAYGYIISPVLENWVVGIQKTRGEWEGPFVQVGPYGNPTNQCADGNSNFDNSWLTLFNNSEVWEDLFSSELTCVGSWFDDEDPDSEANLWCPIWLMDNTDILAYNPWFYALPLTYEDLINSFEYVLFSDMMEECPEGTTFEDVAGISAFYNFLPDSGSINSVVITKLDKQGPQPYLHLDYKSFFDINGMFAGFSHSFEEGLYALMMTTQHGQQVFRMLDVQGTLTVSGTYADLIDVNVFPVPITGNNYQISLLSPLQTRVNYIFADVNGTVLHRQLLSLEGGEQGTFRIAPRSGVPSGVHVHRFEFADGSHTTVTSTK